MSPEKIVYLSYIRGRDKGRLPTFKWLRKETEIVNGRTRKASVAKRSFKCIFFSFHHSCLFSTVEFGKMLGKKYVQHNFALSTLHLTVNGLSYLVFPTNVVLFPSSVDALSHSWIFFPETMWMCFSPSGTLLFHSRRKSQCRTNSTSGTW